MVVVAFAMSHVTKRRTSYIHSGDSFYEHCTHIKKKKKFLGTLFFQFQTVLIFVKSRRVI